jgi:hypothetical protein
MKAAVSGHGKCTSAKAPLRLMGCRNEHEDFEERTANVSMKKKTNTNWGFDRVCLGKYLCCKCNTSDVKSRFKDG